MDHSVPPFKIILSLCLSSVYTLSCLNDIQILLSISSSWHSSLMSSTCRRWLLFRINTRDSFDLKETKHYHSKHIAYLAKHLNGSKPPLFSFFFFFMDVFWNSTVWVHSRRRGFTGKLSPAMNEQQKSPNRFTLKDNTNNTACSSAAFRHPHSPNFMMATLQSKTPPTTMDTFMYSPSIPAKEQIAIEHYQDTLVKRLNST